VSGSYRPLRALTFSGAVDHLSPSIRAGSEPGQIGAAIYHALGYNVVQGYAVDVDPAQITIAPTHNRPE
jgi:hypothetical protein